jgi:hypothetical protein
VGSGATRCFVWMATEQDSSADRDPTTARSLDPLTRGNSSGSSMQQESNFYDGGFNGPVS